MLHWKGRLGRVGPSTYTASLLTPISPCIGYQNIGDGACMDFGSDIHQQCQGIGIVTKFFYRHTLIFILHEWPNSFGL